MAAALARGAAKQAARLVLGDYQIYAIYGLDLEAAMPPDLGPWQAAGFTFGPVSRGEVEAAADPGLRERAHYAGPGSASYGIRHGGDLVCVQFHWFGDRYRQRNFWPLAADEVKSVEFYTVPALRGRGVGPAIKAYSAWELKELGFRRVFSRVWHSHTASRRANEKAGWRHVATVVEVRPFGLPRPLRLVRHHR